MAPLSSLQASDTFDKWPTHAAGPPLKPRQVASSPVLYLKNMRAPSRYLVYLNRLHGKQTKKKWMWALLEIMAQQSFFTFRATYDLGLHCARDFITLQVINQKVRARQTGVITSGGHQICHFVEKATNAFSRGFPPHPMMLGIINKQITIINHEGASPPEKTPSEGGELGLGRIPGMS